MLKKIAHRFFADRHLENSPTALDFAIKNKAWALETDVQLTKDKTPILMHDKTLNRTTNFKGYVKDFTYAELNANCRLNNGDKIPTLDFLLNKLKGQNIKLYLEIISSDVVDILPYYLKNYATSVDIIVSSFHHELLLNVKKTNPNQRTMALFECNPINPIAMVESANVEEVGIGFDSINNVLVSTLQNKNYDVYAWTVNSNDAIELALEMGINGIFTDKL